MVEITGVQLAKAFTEWDRRYREEPSRFATEALLHAGTAEEYGGRAARYLLAILAEAQTSS